MKRTGEWWDGFLLRFNGVLFVVAAFLIVGMGAAVMYLRQQLF